LKEAEGRIAMADIFRTHAIAGTTLKQQLDMVA
jgi:hypothetical protein